MSNKEPQFNEGSNCKNTWDFIFNVFEKILPVCLEMYSFSLYRIRTGPLAHGILRTDYPM